MTNAIAELRDVLQARSISLGEFRLASGDVSSYYCDTKATILSPEGNYLIGEVLHPVVLAMGCEAIGGLMMGGPLVAASVANSSYRSGEPIYAFAVRDNQKAHGLRHLIEASYHPDCTDLVRPGRRVCVVDDVVTKGGSVLKAVDAVTQAGAEILCVLALVDRNAGGREALSARGLRYIYAYETDSNGHLRISDEFIRTARRDSERPRTWAVR